MEKGYLVREWTEALARKRPDASFTAGECARGAGVSVNTAKKYLKKITHENEWIYDFSVEMRNGLVATCYAFLMRRED